VAVGMSASTRPLITGRIVDPDNAGGPVAEIRSELRRPFGRCTDRRTSRAASPQPQRPFVQLTPPRTTSGTARSTRGRRSPGASGSVPHRSRATRCRSRASSRPTSSR
jgi:hypothetical protein